MYTVGVLRHGCILNFLCRRRYKHFSFFIGRIIGLRDQEALHLQLETVQMLQRTKFAPKEHNLEDPFQVEEGGILVLGKDCTLDGMPLQNIKILLKSWPTHNRLFN